MANKKLSAQFAEDDFPIYGFDGGNERSKVSVTLPKALRESFDDTTVLEENFVRSAVQLNAVATITKHEYDRACTLRRGQQPDYSFIHIVDGKKDIFLVVGDAAMGFIKDLAHERRMNKAKYTRLYHGIQFIRGLTAIHKGNLPEHCHIIAGHPPLNSEKAQDIQNSLKGLWKLDFMGEKHEVEVHTVKPIDEILGAAMNIRLKLNGNENGRAAIVRNGRTLGFDLGGGTLDVMMLDERGYPMPGSLDSAEVGIFDAVLNFKAAFDSHPEYVKAFGDSTSGISLEQVFDIFRDPQHFLRGGGLENGYIDCSELYTEVMAGELNRIYAMTKSLLGNIETAAQQVVIFGGAGDLLFEDLAENIFGGYARNGRLLRGATKGFGILGASIGMSKFGTMLRRLEAKKLQELK